MKSVFQSFYTKMKQQDKKLKEKLQNLDQKEGFTMNSAKASLTGLSDKLEKRRQAAREAKLKQQEEQAEADKKAAEEAEKNKDQNASQETDKQKEE